MSHAEREHAKYSPSATDKWLHCPAYVPRTCKLPRRPSKDADLGTAAHELAEQCLRGGTNPSDYLGERMPVGVAVDREMVEHITTHVNIVRSFDRTMTVEVEKKIHNRALYGVLVWGTVDVVGRRHPVALRILDLKYGIGEVDAVENEALLTYAVLLNGWEYDSISLEIFQPRCGGHKVWAPSKERIIAHCDEIFSAVSVGETPDAIDRPCAGDWCHWCPVKGSCSAHVALIQQQAGLDFGLVEATPPALPPAATLPDDKLIRLVELGPRLAALIKDAKAEALRRAQAGVTFPGYVLTEGKAGDREWAVTADQLAEAVADPDVRLTSEPELLSPAKIEKALGKKRFKELGLGMLTKQEPGKVTLRPEKGSDKPTVQDDFAD